MTAVLHVLDAGCDETQLQVLELLRRRLADKGVSQTLCCIDGPASKRARAYLSGEIVPAVRRLLPQMNWAPRLATVAHDFRPAVVHAWGIEAARAATARLRGFPLIVTLLDPAATIDVARWIRSFPSDAGVVAGSQIIRSRLIAAGQPAERIVVIRGGVDFAAINESSKTDLRQRLVGDATPALLLTGPPSRGAGQYYGIWAAAIVAQIHRRVRVILPYCGSESDRLRRFAKQIRMTDMLRVPKEGITWPQLVACADMLVSPAIGEVCTEPIAWAMAGGIPVIGSAVRSTCEIIADKHNGLLCKPKDARALAGRILTAIEDADLRRRIVDVARGQAYEVFSLRAFADHYARLYENAAASRPIHEGITDTAMVA